jgi:predicted DNA-binding transcriptional regulator AlpA
VLASVLSSHFIILQTVSTFNNQKETEMQTQLLSTPQAAKFLNVSIAFLERDRWAGARVPFVKIGSRAVRYRLADLEAYICSNRQQSILEAKHD